MYKRVLLKISGEACSSKTATFDSEFLNELALELKKVINNGIQVAIVVGGGNIMRGKFASQLGLSRMEADKMGMLATVINALAIKSACQSNCLEAVVQSSIEMNRVCDIVDYQKAIDHLEKGHVVIYGGGTGNPYFSTDSAAALRACEISAQAILMAKNGVDGVYDSDPDNNPNAKRFDELSFDDILNMNLKVMDMTAASLCRDNGIDALVFDMGVKGNILKAAKSEAVCTVVKSH